MRETVDAAKKAEGLRSQNPDRVSHRISDSGGFMFHQPISRGVDVGDSRNLTASNI